jgi:hypothetical protein
MFDEYSDCLEAQLATQQKIQELSGTAGFLQKGIR